MAWVRGGVQISENIFMQLKDEIICHLKILSCLTIWGTELGYLFFYSIQRK